MAELLGEVPVMSACGGPGMKALRSALVASVALAFLAGMATSADAAYYPHSTGSTASATIRSFKKPRAASTDNPQKAKPNPEKEGFADMPKAGVLQIAISIGSQRLSLYRDGERVAQAPVSTGTASHPTPMGVFSVIEKDRFHRSNIYGNAPMSSCSASPGRALRCTKGMLPGYQPRTAASGCRATSRRGCGRPPSSACASSSPAARSRRSISSIPACSRPKPKPAEPKVAMIDACRRRQAGSADSDGGEPTTTAKDAGGGAARPCARRAARSSPLRAAIDHAQAERPRGAPARRRRRASGDVKPVSPQTAEAAPDPPRTAVKATGTVDSVRPEEAPRSHSAELRKAVEAPQPLEPPKPGRPCGRDRRARDHAGRGRSRPPTPVKPAAEPHRSAQADGAAPDQVRRSADQAQRAGGGVRQPQGEEDFRAAGIRAAVRHADHDRAPGSAARHPRVHRHGPRPRRRRHALEPGHDPDRRPTVEHRAPGAVRRQQEEIQGAAAGRGREGAVDARRRRSTASRCPRKRSSASARF